MSICSIGMNNGVLGLGAQYCACSCHKINWSVHPPICNCNCRNQNSATVPPVFQEKINIVQNQINAQEHSINHTQEGIEACLSWLDKIDPPLRQPNGTIANIFEFIAVDPKRRDDIRHIKNALYELYCWILNNVQDNKYRSNGIDLLEAAAMQLNKAISRRKDNGT